MAINHLPPEILRDILLSLPIKSLNTTARFVNKCWFDIISSSYFVSARLKKSEEDKSFSDHRVIFNFTDSGLLFKQFPIEFRDSSSINLVNFGCSSRHVWFVGSCNGLICVLSKEMRLILLNPCTGEYNELRPLILEPRRGYNRAISYGFGYDASSDDYKVVVVFSPEEKGVGDENIYGSVVQVYSLKSNSWRRIEDLSGSLFCSFGKFARGKVYWYTNYGTPSYNENKIVWFDVGSEVFGKFELPVDTRYTRLDVLGGCICLLVQYDGSHADLWLMKEYGAWTKTVTVSYTNVPKMLRMCSLLPNGEILFFAKERLFIVYNPNDGSFKFLDKPRWRYGHELPFIYVQSLVSPICTQVRGRKKAKLV